MCYIANIVAYILFISADQKILSITNTVGASFSQICAYNCNYICIVEINNMRKCIHNCCLCNCQVIANAAGATGGPSGPWPI